MESLRFLTPEQARRVRQEFGTPAYVYDEGRLLAQARAMLGFPQAFGLTVRFAMKACPTAAVLRLFEREGLHLDASSGFECERAMLAGIAPQKISLSSQELPAEFDALHRQGVKINACSLRQLERFGQRFPGGEVGVRFNPGLGSGGTRKTNVGGPASSFGVWHEDLENVQALVKRHQLRVVRIHTHIGSGGDPEVWQRVSQLSLQIARQFPGATTLNLGGGFKVGRMSHETSTDPQVVGAPVREAFEAFARETGRKLHLEIEPGTFLVANAGAVVSTVQDRTQTGTEGYSFLKLDTGMTELLRPSLYAAQHPIVVIQEQPNQRTAEYVVVGHCCESGDLLTPSPEAADALQPRRLAEASLGDLCVIEGAGAYCAAMSAKNYNSFPEAPEILLRQTGELQLIRRRQMLGQMVENEVAP